MPVGVPDVPPPLTAATMNAVPPLEVAMVVVELVEPAVRVLLAPTGVVDERRAIWIVETWTRALLYGLAPSAIDTLNEVVPTGKTA